MIVLFVIAAFVFIELPGIKDIPDAAAGQEQLEIKVNGRQFYWQYEYPNGVIAIDHMPAMTFGGDTGTDGRQYRLFRPYAFTDRDCVNAVFRGSVVGGPAFAPRISGPLKLPTNQEELDVALAGILPSAKSENAKTYMAVLIASELRKEFAGDPLFDNVSFTVGRKDRLSLAGANGAGKTTLLRAIAGETSIQGGKLAFQKGVRIALHDQRPPLEFDISLREYALSGARDLLEVEGELQRLEQTMADGDHGDATLRRYAEAQARLEHAPQVEPDERLVLGDEHSVHAGNTTSARRPPTLSSDSSPRSSSRTSARTIERPVPGDSL